MEYPNPGCHADAAGVACPLELLWRYQFMSSDMPHPHGNLHSGSFS